MGRRNHVRGRKLAPRQCCRPCEAWLRHDAKAWLRHDAKAWLRHDAKAWLRHDAKAWLRHDAKMLVTPRAPDAIWGMAADKTFALRGAAKAASATSKEKGPTRPAPRLIPSGAKRREAIASDRCNDLPPPSRTAHILPFDLQSFRFSRPSLPGGYLNGAILYVTKCQESRQSGVFRPVPFASVSPRSSWNCGVCVPSVSLWSQSNWQT